MPEHEQPDQLLTKAQLLAWLGRDIPESQWNEWRRHGSIPPHVDARGHGRGRGKTYFWTHQQAELIRHLLTIPSARRDHLIVNLWRSREASYHICLQQVKKAMAHWAERERAPSRLLAAKGARELVEMFANSDGTRQATMKLTEILYRSEIPLVQNAQASPRERANAFIEQVENALSYAMDSSKPGNAAVPSRFSARWVAVQLWNYEQCVEALRSLHAFEDWIWFYARHLLLSEALYHEGPFQADPDSACMELALALGLAWLSRDTKSGQAWKQRIASTQVRQLPDGRLIERAFYRQKRHEERRESGAVSDRPSLNNHRS